MITKKIEDDIQDEFLQLRKELKNYLTDNFEQKKEFLKGHVPKEVIYKSELLLDTLLNYLMEEALNELKNADIELQNKFFDADFRKRINEWVIQLENKLILDPDVVKYSTDPRLKQGLIAGGITFVTGSVITATVFIPTMVVEAIISGFVTILVSALIFKSVYNKSSLKAKARESIKIDIEEYLINAEIQVREWLKLVIKTFSKDFSEFCSTNGFMLNGEIE